MREIKFRGWNKILNCMDNWYDLLDKNLRNIFIMKNHNGYELMQYTGLHDKNGKEIYEGDIIKLTNGGEIRIGKVIYEYSGFIIDVMNMNKPYGRVSFYMPEKFIEVIGNINDNPDLLKEDK